MLTIPSWPIGCVGQDACGASGPLHRRLLAFALASQPWRRRTLRTRVLTSLRSRATTSTTSRTPTLCIRRHAANRARTVCDGAETVGNTIKGRVGRDRRSSGPLRDPVFHGQRRPTSRFSPILRASRSTTSADVQGGTLPPTTTRRWSSCRRRRAPRLHAAGEAIHGGRGLLHELRRRAAHRQRHHARRRRQSPTAHHRRRGRAAAIWRKRPRHPRRRIRRPRRRHSADDPGTMTAAPDMASAVIGPTRQ